MIWSKNLDIVNVFVIFTIALLLSFVSIIIGKKLNIIDIPSPEKIHKDAIPRSGGIAIFLTFLIGVSFFNKFLTEYELIFLSLIFLLGLIDDVLSISQRIKFSVELVLIISLFLKSQPTFSGIFLLDVLFFTFYLLGSINAMNAIDGMDGLSGGIALISSLFLSYWIKDTPIIIAIACLGFLIWNFHPARLFMGDSGSLFLGAVIGIMSLNVLQANPSLPLLISLIFIYFIPIFDLFLTILRRLTCKSPLFKPDLSHPYNKLYTLLGSYVKTVLIVYGSSIALGLLGLYVYRMEPIYSLFVGGFILAIMTYLGYKLGFVKG